MAASGATAAWQPVEPGTVLVGHGRQRRRRSRAGPASSSIRPTLAPSSPATSWWPANTDPAWTPLFVPAGGVVASVGAMGSHTMIVSRELGIPCVVSVEDATLRIPDGAMVTVDGDEGDGDGRRGVSAPAGQRLSPFSPP